MLKRPIAPREHLVGARETDAPVLVRLDDGPDGWPVRVPGSHDTDASSAPVSLVSLAPMDPVLAQVAGEVWDDPRAVGLLLHGSRARRMAGPDSNYDFITIVEDTAYAERRERGTLVERRLRLHSPTIEIALESLGRLMRSARRGGSRARAFASSIVLLDKSGDIQPLVSAIVAGSEPASELVTEEYDRYLKGFAHSLKSSSRGDDLGARAHAAESGFHLVSALFALEGKSAPYPDHLSVRLAELDQAQGWRPGFLHGAILRLLYAPDLPFQQMLDRRVSRLMDSRGIRHESRDDLEQLRHVKYDEL